MVTTWPAGFPGSGNSGGTHRPAYSGNVRRRALEVEVYGAGEIVGAFEVFDAVSNGVADMYHAAEYYWQGRSPAYNFFCAVPMGMTAHEIMAWVEFGGGQALWNELAGQFNLIAFQAGNTGHQMGGWFKQEVNSLQDFRGLRMRIPGLGGSIIRELGGAAVALSGGEIYSSLQSGAIDATEWVGPWNDLAFGFYREAPFYYGPGFHEPGSALAVGMNLGVWDSLPGDHQAIIRAACRAANNQSLAEFTYQNGIALAHADPGARRAVAHVLRRDLDRGRADRRAGGRRHGQRRSALAAGSMRAIWSTRRLGRDWANVSEAPYYRQRERVLGR
jgi:TRAP-type mannitol/chloroaromatic compound transport system substrate-binding protein